MKTNQKPKMKWLLTLLFIGAFLSTYAQYPQLTAEEWRADLQYLKQKINNDYSHLFYKVSSEDFNHAVKNLDQKIPTLASHEIIVEFTKLIAMFKYGHTGIPLNKSYHGEKLKTGFHMIPINFYHFKDGLFVQGVHRDYEKAVGAKVLRILNKSVEEALKAVKPVVSVENEQFFKAYGLSYLACPEVLHAQGVVDKLESIPIVFSKNGEKFTINFQLREGVHVPAWYGFVENNENWISARNSDHTPLWFKNIKRIYHFEYLKDSKTVYVRHSQAQNDPEESIPRFYQRVFDFVEQNEVDKFILDLRLNGGGDGYNNKPIILGLIKSKINQKGKLFTIIGRNTFSAAQNMVNKLEDYTETTFIGEPTSENVNFFGDTKIEVLPNSQLEMSLSYLWWQNKDPRDKRQWTSPKINVDLSFEDYRMNRDPVLHAVLNYFPREDNALAAIRTHLEKGEIAKAEKLGFDFKNDPDNVHNSLYSKLNSLGYEYLNYNETQRAIAAFTINTKLYPEEPNTWDSLAEGYLNAKDIKKAIQYYEKAISIDPKSRTADHARDMLQKIKMWQH